MERTLSYRIRILIGILLSLVALCANAAKQVTYYLTDPQGTPLATMDAQGNVTGRFDKTSFGRDVLDSGSTRGLTGHVLDEESSLVYMQQRFYDPLLGRFLSVDPVALAVGDEGGFGRYTYVYNNPYGYRDPDGRTGEFTAAGCAITIEIGCAPGAAVGVIIDAAIVIAAIAVPIYMSQDQAPVVTPADGATSKPGTLTPGPHAGDSIPATDSGKTFTPGERQAVDSIGKATGCHTCGTTDPGTKSGHFVPDHQPPSAIKQGHPPSSKTAKRSGFSHNVFPAAASREAR